MRILANPPTFRRTLGGIALIVAPLLNLTAALLSPYGVDMAAAAQLDDVAAHTDRALASAICDLVGVVFFIPAILALVHLLSPRSPRLANIGGCMAIAGLVGFTGLHVFTIVQVEMVKGAANRDEMIALFERLEENAGFAILIALFLLSQVPGLILLSIGLFTTRSVPRLAPVLIWLFLVWDIGLGIAGVEPQIAGIIDPHIAGLLGLGMIGALLLRQDDRAWTAGEALVWPPGSPLMPAPAQL